MTVMVIHPTATALNMQAMYACSNAHVSTIPRHPEGSLNTFPEFPLVPLRPDPEHCRKGERDLKRQREDRCE
jgi:hypothetical protein